MLIESSVEGMRGDRRRVADHGSDSSFTGMPSALPLPIALLLALAPAVFTWWTGRLVLRRPDDPALPELLFAQRKRLAMVTWGGMLLLVVFFGGDWYWTMPVLVLALVVSQYPLRRTLFGESWSVIAYLRFWFFSAIGGMGFWLLAALTPALVLMLVAEWSPEGDAAGALRWAVALGALFGGLLLLWQRNYAHVWLQLHRATLLRDSVRPELMARLEGILDRAGASLHRRPAVFRYGEPGGHVMNAFAIPSLSAPSVALGDTLLATLTEDEIVAVFAHEIAHHEHFNARRLWRARWAGWFVVLVFAALPALLVGMPDSPIGIATWALPVAILLALGFRAGKSRHHETQSDLRAVALTGDPHAMASALRKLHVFSRVPRRWSHDFERLASHPSLARRIQAIMQHGTTTEVALGAPTLVRSVRPGAVVALEGTRAHWFEGVPDDTPADLALLRERASSYRAFAYGELTELRVAVSADERSLAAEDRQGRRWSVPVRPEDVPALQAALDLVDVRLGKRDQPAEQRPAIAARLLSVILFVTLMMAGELGMVLLPMLLIAVRPTTAAIAATAAIALVRSLITLASVPYEGFLQTAAVAVSAGIAVAMIVIVVLRARAVGRVARQKGTDAVDGWTSARLSIGLLGSVALLSFFAIVPSMVAAPGPGLPDHPLALPLATALLGMGAAVATMPRRRWRLLGSATSMAAAVGAILLSGDGWLFGRVAPLSWKDGRAVAVATIPIDGNAFHLELSPGARRYAVQYMAPSRRREAGVARYTVGVIGEHGAPGERRSLEATGLAFLSDDEILILSAVNDDSLELRLERLGATGLSDAVTWRRRLRSVEAPALFVDRAQRAWMVVGREEEANSVVVLSGVAGSDSVTTQQSTVDGMVTHTMVAFRDGTALSLAMPRTPEASASVGWLAALGSMSTRWQLVRTRGGRSEVVGNISGFPTCSEVVANDTALCSELDRRRRVRLWRARPTGKPELLAILPTAFDLFHSDGANRIAIASRMSSHLAVIDIDSRRATEVALPATASSTDNRRWAVAVATAGNYLGTLTSGRGGSSLTLVRVEPENR